MGKGLNSGKQEKGLKGGKTVQNVWRMSCGVCLVDCCTVLHIKVRVEVGSFVAIPQLFLCASL